MPKAGRAEVLKRSAVVRPAFGIPLERMVRPGGRRGRTMTTAYHVSVWRKAMNDAEADVMCATAAPAGGKKAGEDLMSYVERAKRIQGAAIARWLTAKTELEAAEGQA